MRGLSLVRMEKSARLSADFSHQRALALIAVTAAAEQDNQSGFL